MCRARRCRWSMDKIPFVPHTDPVHQREEQLVRGRGGNPFRNCNWRLAHPDPAAGRCGWCAAKATAASSPCWTRASTPSSTAGPSGRVCPPAGRWRGSRRWRRFSGRDPVVLVRCFLLEASMHLRQGVSGGLVIGEISPCIHHGPLTTQPKTSEVAALQIMLILCAKRCLARHCGDFRSLHAPEALSSNQSAGSSGGIL